MNNIKALGSQWIAVAYTAAISSLLIFFLGRILGPENFGIYSYALTLASLFAMAQDGGFKTLIFRECVSPTQNMGCSIDDLVRMALSHILFVTGCGLLILFFIPSQQKATLSSAMLCLALVCATHIVSSRLKGNGRFKKEAAWQATCRTTTALVIIAGIFWIKPEPMVLFLSWATGLVIVFLISSEWKSFFTPSFSLPPKKVWRACLAFLVIDASTTLYFRIDIIILFHLLSDHGEVGNYTAAYRALDGIILLLTPVANICFRHLRLRWRNQRDFKRSLFRMLAGMSALSAAIVVAGYFTSSFLIKLAYGDGYALAERLLPIILLALVFIMPNYILTQAMIALNREKFYAISALCAAVFNVGLNMWVIPEYKTMGAAWATVGTEGLLTLLLGLGIIFFMRRTR